MRYYVCRLDFQGGMATLEVMLPLPLKYYNM